MALAPASTESRLATEVAELFPPQGQWSEWDYFSLPDTNRLTELAEGRVIMPPHPTWSHQAAMQELYVQLRAFVNAKDLGEVYVCPLPVRLRADKVREPDVLFMSAQHADRIAEQFFGPPDLVMEVTSPSTRRTDRTEKAREYARAGIPEYWIADPDAHTVEVFVLKGQRYAMLGKWATGGVARSSLLPGFEVVVDSLFL